MPQSDEWEPDDDGMDEDDGALDEEFPLGDGVAALESEVSCPYCGETVEIGRRGIAAVKGHVRPAEIVSDDEDDVGLGFGSMECG